MKMFQSAEAQTHFSSVLKEVEDGNEVAIAQGSNKQAVAVIIPYEKWKKNQKRQLGTLEGRAEVSFSPDFLMSDEEFIHS